jgi:hypothetical protein
MRGLLCDACAGRGWVYADSGSDFSNKCSVCSDKGWMSFRDLGKRIGENDRTLRRLFWMRAQAKTAERVFGKISALLGWA